MPDLISTVPGDIGSGGPAMPAAAPDPQPGPESGTPTPGPGPATPPPSAPDNGDPGKSGAPALASDTPPDPKPSTIPTPSTPAPSPEVLALRAQVDTLTQLVGQLKPSTSTAPAAPARDFAGEKAALDEAFRAEKIDQAAYAGKVFELATEMARAEAQTLVNQGNQNTVQAVQAELKRAEDAAHWKALCTELPGLADFAQSPDFAALKAQNPLHDPLSAFLTHQLTEAKAATEKAVTEAKAAKEKEMVEAIRAKGHAAVLGNPGGQAPKGGIDFDAMLKEPEKYGGVTAVQTMKLKHMRTSASA